MGGPKKNFARGTANLFDACTNTLLLVYTVSDWWIGGERFETDDTTVSRVKTASYPWGVQWTVPSALAKQLVVQLAFDTTSGYQGRLFTHDTFSLNLRLDRGKCVLFIGRER